MGANIALLAILILDIVGDPLADGCQLNHLVFDDGIVGRLGKLPIHHRLVL
ncbi:MAG TPA: hypothetical protein VI386_10110 [Candidatus Sulfotelmatobacter sp.]